MWKKSIFGKKFYFCLLRRIRFLAKISIFVSQRRRFLPKLPFCPNFDFRELFSTLTLWSSSRLSGMGMRSLRQRFWAVTLTSNENLFLSGRDNSAMSESCDSGSFLDAVFEFGENESNFEIRSIIDISSSRSAAPSSIRNPISRV